MSMGYRGQFCEPSGPCIPGDKAVFAYLMLSQACSVWGFGFTKAASYLLFCPLFQGQDFKVKKEFGMEVERSHLVTFPFWHHLRRPFSVHLNG